MTWIREHHGKHGKRAVIYWQDKTYYVALYINNNQLVDVQRGPSKSWGWARRQADRWVDK